jgi:hypothetical protein
VQERKNEGGRIERRREEKYKKKELKETESVCHMDSS